MRDRARNSARCWRRPGVSAVSSTGTFRGLDELAQIAGFVAPALARHHVGKLAASEIDAVPVPFAVGVYPKPGIGGQRSEQFFPGEIQRPGLGQGALDVVAKRFVAALQTADKPLGARKATVVQHD